MANVFFIFFLLNVLFVSQLRHQLYHVLRIHQKTFSVKRIFFCFLNNILLSFL